MFSPFLSFYLQVTDFTSNVSHEIKTPLAAIQGFVETLHQGSVKDPDEARRFLGIIQKHVKRLTAIIDDLMKLTHLEQGKAYERLNFEQGAVIDAIHRAIQLCRTKAEGEGINISVDCDTVLFILNDTHDMSVHANSRMHLPHMFTDAAWN